MENKIKNSIVDKERILEFCKIIRESFPQAEEVYTHGSCYKFHEILKCFTPLAIPYNYLGHIITKIGCDFYDITGEIFPDKEKLMNLLDEPTILIKYKNCIYDIDEYYNPKFKEPVESTNNIKNRLHKYINIKINKE